MISLTDKGAEKVNEFLSKQDADVETAGLRVGVRGGGCSGFQYALAFDAQRDGDTVFESHGIRLLVDNASLPYVHGAEVDYVEGLQGAGFQVNNPNVIASCGCGSSFRVRDEEEVSAVSAALAAVLLAGCGGKPAPQGSLATGLTEYSPAALTGPARSLHPRYARVYVLWSAVQPSPAPRFDWGARAAGGFSVRAQVRAIEQAGYEPLVTFYSTPAWAARPASGCEPPRPNVNARAPRGGALPAYRAMVGSFLAMARAEGLDVRYLSAWNEPNSGLFLAPQRTRCDPATSPSLGAAEYAPIARALSAALAAAPGEQEQVLGEASSPHRARPIISTVDEFVRALPRDVACGGRIWGQHQYVGDADGVAQAERALAPTPCGPRELWVTETGAGARKPGAPRAYDAATLRAACRNLDSLLDRWWADPKVTAAFQYTLREDPNFPVGLAAATGGTPYPTYALWRAWGEREQPTDPPPALPKACA